MERGVFVRYHFLFRFFGFTISAILIVLGALQFINSTVDVILISTGTSLLAGTIASVFDTIFLRNPSPHDPRKLGLVECYLSDQAHFSERIKNAHSLDIIFNTGRQVFNNYENALDTAFQNRKCTIRILTSNSKSPIFRDPDLKKALSSSPTADLRYEIENIKDKIRQKVANLNNQGAHVEMRWASCMITGSLIIIDKKFVRYNPYLPYTSSSTVPVFDIVRVGGDDLLTLYQRRFDDIWDKAGEERSIIPPSKTAPLSKK